jgi:SAM-dependent methyltransferase
MNDLHNFYDNIGFPEIQSELNEKRIEIKKKGLLGKVVEKLRAYEYPIVSILDIGGGSGINLTLYSEVTGATKLCSIDIREPKIKLNGINYIKSAVEDLPSLNLPKFDAITLTEVIEHLLDPDSVLENIVNLLDDNGVLIITTPNLGSILNIMTLILGFQPPDTEVSIRKPYARPFRRNGGQVVGHVHVFTVRSLREMIETHGLRVLSINTCGIVFNKESAPLHLRIISLLDRLFSYLSPYGGTRIIAVCSRSK